jgi:hypothetical protein
MVVTVDDSEVVWGVEGGRNLNRIHGHIGRRLAGADRGSKNALYGYIANSNLRDFVATGMFVGVTQRFQAPPNIILFIMSMVLHEKGQKLTVESRKVMGLRDDKEMSCLKEKERKAAKELGQR